MNKIIKNAAAICAATTITAGLFGCSAKKVTPKEDSAPTQTETSNQQDWNEYCTLADELGIIRVNIDTLSAVLDSERELTPEVKQYVTDHANDVFSFYDYAVDDEHYCTRVELYDGTTKDFVSNADSRSTTQVKYFNFDELDNLRQEIESAKLKEYDVGADIWVVRARREEECQSIIREAQGNVSNWRWSTISVYTDDFGCHYFVPRDERELRIPVSDSDQIIALLSEEERKEALQYLLELKLNSYEAVYQSVYEV